MIKFLKNLINISIYAIVFCVFIGISGWKLETREIIAISLILGFFAGLLNNIEVVLCELFDKRNDNE